MLLSDVTFSFITSGSFGAGVGFGVVGAGVAVVVDVVAVVIVVSVVGVVGVVVEVDDVVSGVVMFGDAVLVVGLSVELFGGSGVISKNI